MDERDLMAIGDFTIVPIDSRPAWIVWDTYGDQEKPEIAGPYVAVAMATPMVRLKWMGSLRSAIYKNAKGQNIEKLEVDVEAVDWDHWVEGQFEFNSSWFFIMWPDFGERDSGWLEGKYVFFDVRKAEEISALKWKNELARREKEQAAKEPPI